MWEWTPDYYRREGRVPWRKDTQRPRRTGWALPLAMNVYEDLMVLLDRYAVPLAHAGIQVPNHRVAVCIEELATLLDRGVIRCARYGFQWLDAWQVPTLHYDFVRDPQPDLVRCMTPGQVCLPRNDHCIPKTSTFVAMVGKDEGDSGLASALTGAVLVEDALYAVKESSEGTLYALQRSQLVQEGRMACAPMEEEA